MPHLLCSTVELVRLTLIQSKYCMIKLPKSVVLEKLTINKGNNELADLAEALQKTVIGKKSDVHDRKESTGFANRPKQP